MTGLDGGSSDDRAADDAAAENASLLAFLAQPRRLGEVRLHFSSHAETVMKRLDRLRGSGQVEQLGFGVVVQAGCPWLPWPLPLRQALLLAVLDQSRLLPDAAWRAGVTSGAEKAMAALVAAGRVRCDQRGMYARAAPALAQADASGAGGCGWPGVPGEPGVVAHGRGLSAYQAMLVALAETRSALEVAQLVGDSQSNVRAKLARLVAYGLVIRVGYGRYVAQAPGNQPETGSGPHTRPQPIRDAILAFLSEPRQAWEVAAHIDRSVPNATGHLAAMCRRGLAARVSYGRYERTDPTQAGVGRGAITRPFPVRDAVLVCLGKPAHYTEIARAARRSIKATSHALRALVGLGLAVQCSKGVFAASGASSPGPARSVHPVCATPGDACAATSEEARCVP